MRFFNRKSALIAIAGLATFFTVLVTKSPAPGDMDTAVTFWSWMLAHVTGIGGDFARLRAHQAAEAAVTRGIAGTWRPLPEEDAAMILANATHFHHRYYHRRQPVVLRGFLDAVAAADGDEPLHRKWSLRRLRDRFRDVDVLVKRDQRSLASLRVERFGDYADRILDARDTPATDFLAPTNELFHADPRMEAEAAGVLDAVYALRGTPRGSFATRLHTAGNEKPYYFFVSAGERFTPLHCDATTTFFVMLEGRKRFWLLPPDQTPYLYPRGDPLNFAYFSAVDDPTPAWDDGGGGGGAPQAASRALPPLVRRAGGFRVALRPGDMLFWPSFFWHSVHSVGGGPASAFSVPAVVDVGGTAAANPVFAAGFLLNPKVWFQFAWGWATKRGGHLRDTYFRSFRQQQEGGIDDEGGEGSSGGAATSAATAARRGGDEL